MNIVSTDRLELEELTVNDSAFVIELLNTPNWLKFIGDRNIKSEADAKAYILNNHIKSYTTNGFGFYKVLLKSENLKPIGCCGLIKRPELDGVDIGFAFLPEYEGFGYGFESASAILNIAHSRFNLDKILAIALATNRNSVKLLEKLGLTYQKTVIPFDDGKELLLFAKNLKTCTSTT
ncbi:GNAT family N-acetyltransferase [Formosa sp. S-31]|uniref:GNAT family N-acetyltransferase n=1 Tax=Formosa sp. S-31 TaxID=2790949 RepID=UPI003EBFF6BD